MDTIKLKMISEEFINSKFQVDQQYPLFQWWILLN